MSQDQPKNKYVAELRDCCERAALEGSWVCTLNTMHTPVMPATFGCLVTSCSAVTIKAAGCTCSRRLFSEINVSSRQQAGCLACLCLQSSNRLPTHHPHSVECYVDLLFVAGSALQADQAAAPEPSAQQRLAAQLPHQPWPAHPLPVRQAAVRAFSTRVQSGPRSEALRKAGCRAFAPVTWQAGL